MRFIIFFAMFWTLSATTAFADWVEASSENFVLRGDISSSKAKKIVEELEEYRFIIFKVLSLDTAPEIIPMKIYVTSSKKDIVDMTGRSSVAGLYKTTREGPAFVAYTNDSFSRNSPARRTVFHEYTHHIMANYAGQVYPQWYNEGIADYLSTFKIDKKGQFQVGLPNSGRAYVLKTEKWMDMNVMTNSVRRYPFKNFGNSNNGSTQSMFYAQSWLATHYIQSTKGMPARLKTYLAALNETGPSPTLFEESFGMTPEKFGELMRAYLKANRFMTLKMTLKSDIVIPHISIRKLSKGEASFHRGEVTRIFRRGPKAQEITDKFYTKASEKGGPEAQIQASRAIVALRLKKYDEAKAHVETALTLAPSDSRVLQVAGAYHLKAYNTMSDGPASDHIKTARDYLKQAMRANPKNMQAHFDYVSSYAIARDTPSKQAIYSAEECSFYYRARNFIEPNMVVVEVLDRSGNLPKARYILEMVKTWGTSPRRRLFAEKLLAKLGPA